MAAEAMTNRGQQMAIRARVLDCRPERAAHKEEPDEQADEQEDLPEPSEVDVFIALMAEPEVGDEPELLLDAEPFAGQRADDDDEQASEQEIDAKALAFRFIARNGRRDEQSGGEPRRGDPEDAELRVPRASDGVGEPFG